MDSQQIQRTSVKNTPDTICGPDWTGLVGICFWLREIAYQLAVLNENHAPTRTVIHANDHYDGGRP